MNKKSLAIGALTLAFVIGSSGIVNAAPNDGSPQANWTARSGGHTGQRPTAMGKVTANNGSSLTITDNKGTTYTIDISGASITKGYGTSSVTLQASDIKVNDQIRVTGTLSGTNVTATKVMVGGGFGRGQNGARRPGTKPTVKPTTKQVVKKQTIFKKPVVKKVVAKKQVVKKPVVKKPIVKKVAKKVK